MKTEQWPPSWNRQRERPEANERVIVLCEDCRCLGYIDGDGVWHQDKDGTPIENVMGWMEVGA